MSDSLQCESCAYYDYDNESDSYECMANFDEDEMSVLYSGRKNSCPYYRFYDEYKMVKKQN